MKLSERKAALLAGTDTIEMEQFSSEEPRMVTSKQKEEEEQRFDKVCLLYHSSWAYRLNKNKLKLHD